MPRRKDPIAAFEALPDWRKEQIWQELDSLTSAQIRARSRPLKAAERKLWRRFRQKAGRPRIGRGVKIVSIGLEKDLLKRTDALAKRRGLNRSALVSEALRAMIASAA